jgi:trk system potassium uptake protein TrkH
MNFRLVLKNLGILMLLLTCAMGVCVGLGYLVPVGPGHNSEISLRGWVISMGITGFFSMAFLYLGRKVSASSMLRRDALGIVGISWIVCSLFASLPYIFCEPGLSAAEAYFETVSGLTTTGASAFAELEGLPKTVLLWRSLTQWLGGMGILAMFVLIASSAGAGSKNLFRAESSMISTDFVGITMQQTARWLWMLYIAITLVCIAGLWAMELTIFQAINYAMATVSTGGFGTENESVSEFGNGVRIWLTIFMFICGISFPLFVAMIRRRSLSVLKNHEEAKTYFVLLLLAFVGAMVSRTVAGDYGDSWFDAAVETVFNLVSVSTTTGFGAGDYDSWPMITKGIILVLMLIGGCAGSTAGGIKVSRVILWFRLLRAEIQRSYRPNLVKNLKLNGRIVPEGTRGQLFVILTSAAACIALGSFLMAAFEPNLSTDGCVSAVISSISNVGPGFSEFGPTMNFSGLSVPTYTLLSGLMILGRLEYIAVLVLLSRYLWKRY